MGGDFTGKKQSGVSKQTDEELMAQYQAGDFVAFDVLYRRHSPRVYEYLRQKTSNENAQDVLQDVFAKLHVSRQKYNLQYPFLPWLFTVTKNALFDFYKKAENKRGHLLVGDENVDSMAAAIEAVPAFDFSSELAALPDNQRQAMELRYLRDWSFEKISALMKTTPENIRQLISRGRKKIRQNHNEGGKK